MSRCESDNPQFDHLMDNLERNRPDVSVWKPRLCPIHGIPDCSPLLNGCTELTRGNESGDDR